VGPDEGIIDAADHHGEALMGVPDRGIVVASMEVAISKVPAA